MVVIIKLHHHRDETRNFELAEFVTFSLHLLFCELSYRVSCTSRHLSNIKLLYVEAIWIRVVTK